jgi:hypothetical protein
MEIKVGLDTTFLHGVNASHAFHTANHLAMVLGPVGEKIEIIKVWSLPIGDYSTVGADEISLLYSIHFDLPLRGANRTFQFTRSGRWRSYSTSETDGERFNEPDGEPEDLATQWSLQLTIMLNQIKVWLQRIGGVDRTGEIARLAEQIPLQEL